MRHIKKRVLSTLTKYYWVVQFISHEHPSSLKASLRLIELGSLDFNMVSKSPLGCWADLPSYYDLRIWLVRHTWEDILKNAQDLREWNLLRVSGSLLLTKRLGSGVHSLFVVHAYKVSLWRYDVKTWLKYYSHLKWCEIVL